MLIQFTIIHFKAVHVDCYSNVHMAEMSMQTSETTFAMITMITIHGKFDS